MGTERSPDIGDAQARLCGQCPWWDARTSNDGDAQAQWIEQCPAAEPRTSDAGTKPDMSSEGISLTRSLEGCS